MTTLSRPDVRNVINRIIDPWVVWVPAPEDKGLAVKLYLSKKLMDNLFRDRRATAMAQYFGHIHGKTSYVDDQGARHAVDAGGLLKGATALFRGLKREMFAPGVDERVYIYLSAPEHDYVYPADRVTETARPLRVEAPELSVFTTFALIGQHDVSEIGDDLRSYGGTGIDGLVIGWQWTHPTDSPTLPSSPETRYVGRIW
jgi:hypothetical protein